MLPAQWLLIDADDTLWENNVLFERVIERFVRLVAHARLSAAEVREVLDEVERTNLVTRGYGSDAFALNLQDAYRTLAGPEPSLTTLSELAALAAGIRDEPMTLIAGVSETLAHLAARHRLVLFTKGDAREQAGKLERSGLAGFFAETRVVREKDTATYRATVAELGARPDQTWMVGNSPRSDINPALGAGLKAVWVPHPDTWRLEHEEVPRDAPGLLVLESFAQLREHF
jgi:putative hydrolase of the HAD superfamily